MTIGATRTLSLLAALALSCAAGCDQDEVRDTGAPSVAPTDASADDALEAYEDLRLKLAAGVTDELSNLALELASRSRRAAEEASGEARGHFEKLAEVANGYAKQEGDLADRRRAFGEISEIVVQLVTVDRELREGRLVYRCDEVEGYDRWVQTGGEMKNPYLGGDDCGDLVPWNED